MLTDVNVLSFSVLNDPTSEHMLNEECLQMLTYYQPHKQYQCPIYLTCAFCLLSASKLPFLWSGTDYDYQETKQITVEPLHQSVQCFS